MVSVAIVCPVALRFAEVACDVEADARTRFGGRQIWMISEMTVEEDEALVKTEMDVEALTSLVVTH